MAGDTLPYIDGTSERLVLGTAQLGMDYGIANRTGTPNPENAAAIIEAAIGGGIREFDTAQAYSRSEKILGRVLSSLGAENSVRIITKGLVEENPGTDGRFRDVVTKSLDNLGIRKLHAFMLHKERLLDKWDGGLGAWARALRDSGLIEHIGVSVYSPEKALQALAIEEITIVQIPSNALDRRFEKAGVFQEANSRKKRIYVRSIFLQGLLIMPLEDLPSQMAFAAPPAEHLAATGNPDSLFEPLVRFHLCFTHGGPTKQYQGKARLVCRARGMTEARCHPALVQRTRRATQRGAKSILSRLALSRVGERSSFAKSSKRSAKTRMCSKARPA